MDGEYSVPATLQIGSLEAPGWHSLGDGVWMHNNTIQHTGNVPPTGQRCATGEPVPAERLSALRVTDVTHMRSGNVWRDRRDVEVDVITNENTYNVIVDNWHAEGCSPPMMNALDETPFAWKGQTCIVEVGHSSLCQRKTQHGCPLIK